VFTVETSSWPDTLQNTHILPPMTTYHRWWKEVATRLREFPRYISEGCILGRLHPTVLSILVEDFSILVVKPPPDSMDLAQAPFLRSVSLSSMPGLHFPKDTIY